MRLNSLTILVHPENKEENEITIKIAPPESVEYKKMIQVGKLNAETLKSLIRNHLNIKDDQEVFLQQNSKTIDKETVIEFTFDEKTHIATVKNISYKTTKKLDLGFIKENQKNHTNHTNKLENYTAIISFDYGKSKLFQSMKLSNNKLKNEFNEEFIKLLNDNKTQLFQYVIQSIWKERDKIDVSSGQQKLKELNDKAYERGTSTWIFQVAIVIQAFEKNEVYSLLENGKIERISKLILDLGKKNKDEKPEILEFDIENLRNQYKNKIEENNYKTPNLD